MANTLSRTLSRKTLVICYPKSLSKCRDSRVQNGTEQLFSSCEFAKEKTIFINHLHPTIFFSDASPLKGSFWWQEIIHSSQTRLHSEVVFRVKLEIGEPKMVQHGAAFQKPQWSTGGAMVNVLE
jgi:hypothetical protein